EKLLGDVASSNVKREDLLIIEGESFPISFGGERIADTFKGVTAENNCEMQVMKRGNGKVIWSPLPVELNQSADPIKALYNNGLTAADVKPYLKWIQGDYPGIYGRKLTFSEGHLFIFVSEFDLDTKIEVQDPITKVTYQFTIASGRAVMYATDLVGKVSATYRPDEVSIQEK